MTVMNIYCSTTAQKLIKASEYNQVRSQSIGQLPGHTRSVIVFFDAVHYHRHPYLHWIKDEIPV